MNSLRADIVLPSLVTNLICYYDFEHPVTENATSEHDLGLSGTDIHLINGGNSMRVGDPAYGASRLALQTQQINPADSGNDDWKAGIYQTNGVASLSAFSSVKGITLMGWVKPTGTNPNLNSVTPATNDYYGAIGLFGLLRGGSEGHAVRALLEIINVSGNLRLVALGRRIDGGLSSGQVRAVRKLICRGRRTLLGMDWNRARIFPSALGQRRTRSESRTEKTFR